MWGDPPSCSRAASPGGVYSSLRFTVGEGGAALVGVSDSSCSSRSAVHKGEGRARPVHESTELYQQGGWAEAGWWGTNTLGCSACPRLSMHPCVGLDGRRERWRLGVQKQGQDGHFCG